MRGGEFTVDMWEDVSRQWTPLRPRLPQSCRKITNCETEPPTGVARSSGRRGGAVATAIRMHCEQPEGDVSPIPRIGRQSREVG